MQYVFNMLLSRISDSKLSMPYVLGDYVLARRRTNFSDKAEFFVYAKEQTKDGIGIPESEKELAAFDATASGLLEALQFIDRKEGVGNSQAQQEDPPKEKFNQEERDLYDELVKQMSRAADLQRMDDRAAGITTTRISRSAHSIILKRKEDLGS